MKRKLMSVIDDIRIHHQFDDSASVEYKIIGNMLKVLVFNAEEKIEVASIELPDSGCE